MGVVKRVWDKVWDKLVWPYPGRDDYGSFRHCFWPEPSVTGLCRECGQREDHYSHELEGRE